MVAAQVARYGIDERPGALGRVSLDTCAALPQTGHGFLHHVGRQLGVGAKHAQEEAVQTAGFHAVYDGEL